MREKLKSRGGRFLAAGLVAASLASGCVTPPEGPRMLKGVEHDDIPVPDRFEYVSSEQPYLEIVEEGQFRSWRGTYKGTGRFADLVPWYIEAMRKHGWTFRDLQGVDNDRRLRFTKGEELAEVRIYRRVDAAAGAFINFVDAEIHPRGVEDESVEAALANLRGEEARARTASYSASGAVDREDEDAGGSAAGEPATVGSGETAAGTNGAATENAAEQTAPAASGRVRIRVIDDPSTRRPAADETGVDDIEREIQSVERR